MHIETITADNLFDICELTTNSDGIGTVFEQYICCNSTSIAEAAYFTEMHPFALYLGDKPIGFFMYRHFPNEPTATLCRFMLDYRFQGKGYGKQAFTLILQHIKALGVADFELMIEPENLPAKRLYESFGFVATGKIDKGEHYYRLSM